MAKFTSVNLSTLCNKLKNFDFKKINKFSIETININELNKVIQFKILVAMDKIKIYIGGIVHYGPEIIRNTKINQL